MHTIPKIVKTVGHLVLVFDLILLNFYQGQLSNDSQYFKIVFMRLDAREKCSFEYVI